MEKDEGPLASSLVERVARALWEAEGVAFGWCHEDRTRLPKWEDAVARELFGVGVFRIFARAAIEAMREPTEGMIRYGKTRVHGMSDEDAAETAERVFRAMIATALSK